MANKTPYEIRSDLLALAQRICYDQACAKAAAEGKVNIEKAPTTDEVVAEAEKLNVFVSQDRS